MGKRSNKIYFARADNGLIKIGKSNKPANRMKALQTGSPIKLRVCKTIKGGMYLETLIHNYFNDTRNHGEWFKPDYELSSFLSGKRKITISSLIDAYTYRKQRISSGMKKYMKFLDDNRLYL